LLRVLKSNALSAQLKAIESLQEFGPKAAAAIPAMRALQHDADARVKTAAESALYSIESDDIEITK